MVTRLYWVCADTASSGCRQTHQGDHRQRGDQESLQDQGRTCAHAMPPLTGVRCSDRTVSSPLGPLGRRQLQRSAGMSIRQSPGARSVSCGQGLSVGVSPPSQLARPRSPSLPDGRGPRQQYGPAIAQCTDEGRPLDHPGSPRATLVACPARSLSRWGAHPGATTCPTWYRSWPGSSRCRRR